jgi:hypothetical protein
VNSLVQEKLSTKKPEVRELADRLKQLLKDSPAAASEPQAASPSVVSRRESFLLDLELVTGERFALPYTSLLSLKLDPSTGLIATFNTHVVTITGVNLRAVYDALVSRAAGTLKAVGDMPAKYADDVVVIYTIELMAR